MTREQLEDYLERLLPKLQKRYVYFHDEKDLCQKAILDIWKKHKLYDIKTDKEFRKLFLSFYRTWQWYRRKEIARKMTKGDFISEFMVAERTIREDDKGYDPWCTDRTEAIEYIELVGNPLLKQILMWYYVEGYTMKEIAKGLNKSTSSTEALLKQGVQKIKDEYSH